MPHDDRKAHEAGAEPPSKSARKPAGHAAQDLGEALTALRDAELEALELPEALLDAIRAARRITSRAAAVRQRQYIGRLMREVDLESIRAALATRDALTRRDAERFRQITAWRERLIAEGPPALTELSRHHPQIDRDDGRGASRPPAPSTRARAAAPVRRASCFALCAHCSIQCRDDTAGRHHHGLIVRLGDDAVRRRAVGYARSALRGARRVRPPHARPAVRIRLRSARAGPRSADRRRGRCGASAGHDGRQDPPAGARGAGAVEIARGTRLAAVDRADAGRSSGRNVRDRSGRRRQRSALRRRHPRQPPPRARHRARGLSRAADPWGAPQSRPARDPALMTVGIVGAGQLGRMLALAGYPLGLDFLCLDPSREAPAGAVAPLLTGAFTDSRLLRVLARRCEVLTFDWEDVPAASPREVARKPGARICPPIAALAAGQDRVAEKRLFERLKIPTTRWRAVSSRAELARAIARIGVPGMPKTRRLGYDGKGQAVIRTGADAERAGDRLGRAPLL